jgi:hypothetical protein
MFSKIADKLSNVANPAEFLEKHWASVENVVFPKMLSMVENGLTDDAGLTSLFEGAYEALPLPVRLAVSRDRFITFCLERKEPLAVKLKAYRAERDGEKPSVAIAIGNEAPSMTEEATA